MWPELCAVAVPRGRRLPGAAHWRFLHDGQGVRDAAAVHTEAGVRRRALLPDGQSRALVVVSAGLGSSLLRDPCPLVASAVALDASASALEPALAAWRRMW